MKWRSFCENELSIISVFLLSIRIFNPANSEKLDDRKSDRIILNMKLHYTGYVNPSKGPSTKGARVIRGRGSKIPTSAGRRRCLTSANSRRKLISGSPRFQTNLHATDLPKLLSETLSYTNFNREFDSSLCFAKNSSYSYIH